MPDALMTHEREAVMSFNETYHKLVSSGAHVGSHEADMYVDDNLHVRDILKQEGIAVRLKDDRPDKTTSSPFFATVFRDNHSGKPSLEVALYFERDQAEVRFHSALETELHGITNQKPAGFYNVFEDLRTKHPEFPPSVIDDLVETVMESQTAHKDAPVAIGIAKSALATMLVHGREFSDAFMQKFSDRINSGAIRAHNGKEIIKEAGDLYHAIAQSMPVEDILTIAPVKIQEDRDRDAGNKPSKSPEPGM